ncbi:MAG TPA: phosphocholine cytidylyltransferase family protein [Bacteroidota bacterium]|nr:phosphocholine cytidylyltransferase family protein [Bacteroidota bacterium]
MHCVILAAGTASRLRPLTDSTPKCLLQIGHRTILERTIRAVFHAGIIHFTIVVGFQDWKVKNFLKRNFPSLDFTFVVNNRFDTTNNAFSLLLARDEIIGHELLLLDGDILFDDEIIPLVMKSPRETTLAVRTSDSVGAEDVKVEVKEGGEIIRIGKELPAASAFGESIGIEKFSRGDTTKLYDTLEKRIKTENRVDEFYEASFQELIDGGTKIYAIDAGKYRSIEVDTPEDLQTAESLFS